MKEETLGLEACQRMIEQLQKRVDDLEGAGANEIRAPQPSLKDRVARKLGVEAEDVLKNG